MSLFSNTNYGHPIAIDIGSRAVKVLQLAGRRGNLRVQAAGKFDIPVRLRREDERRELIRESLTDLLNNNDFKGRKVLTTVPNNAVKFKSFRLPQMPADELTQVARFEAEERFAFTEPEAEFRFLQAGEVRQGHESREEIIAMGCPGSALRAQLAMIDDLGFVCEGVAVAPCAIAQGFMLDNERSNDPDIAQVCVDIGHQTSRIVITRGKEIIFIKAIAVGGYKFDELTAKTLNLSIAEAAQLRCEVLARFACPDSADSVGMQKEILDSALEAIRPAVEQLGKEIGLCLRYYAVTFRSMRPEELVCVGGESYNPHVLQILTEITGVKAIQGPPFRQIGTEGAFSEAERRSGLLEWTTVAALALRNQYAPRRKKVAT